MSNTRQLIEKNINVDCELIKIYSDTNLGCAKRIQTGLDEVFKHEECAIILEDDTLPDLSFFTFSTELLLKYENDPRISHISGCNLFADSLKMRESYCFSSIINIWGWATWRRSWKNYDLAMPSWKNINKKQLLSKFCVSSAQQQTLSQNVRFTL